MKVWFESGSFQVLYRKGSSRLQLGNDDSYSYFFKRKCPTVKMIAGNGPFWAFWNIQVPHLTVEFLNFLLLFRLFEFVWLTDRINVLLLQTAKINISTHKGTPEGHISRHSRQSVCIVYLWHRVIPLFLFSSTPKTQRPSWFGGPTSAEEPPSMAPVCWLIVTRQWGHHRWYGFSSDWKLLLRIYR